MVIKFMGQGQKDIFREKCTAFRKQRVQLSGSWMDPWIQVQLYKHFRLNFERGCMKQGA